MGNIYTNIANYGYKSLEGKLKPTTCPSCKADDYYDAGICAKCLANQAYNKEYLETHLFLTDTDYSCYHSQAHDNFKKCPRRMPDEHPYLYYGCEVEVEFDPEYIRVRDDDDDYYEETMYDRDEVVREALKIADGLFVAESDCSLTNGVEFITPPCSYRFLTSKPVVEKLKAFFDYLKKHGALLDQPNSNGCHIHLSKKFFDYGETHLERRLDAYESFNWLFQVFQTEIEQLGGRPYNSQYSASEAQKITRDVRNRLGYYSGIDIEAKLTLKKKGMLMSTNHDSAVISSGPTIEARVFKSTVDYRQLLANVEMVRNFAHAVREEDTKRSLNDILHTKDNLYLDEHIQRTRMALKKKGETLDLDKVADDQVTITINQ